MPEDLSPKILDLKDDTELGPGSTARRTTVLTFMLGKFGPFREVLDREHTGADIDNAITKRKLPLLGRV